MSVQYATPDRLKDRIALHERYAPEQEPFHAWLFRQVQAPKDAAVLEVGCGSGHFWTVNARAVPAADVERPVGRHAGRGAREPRARRPERGARAAPGRGPAVPGRVFRRGVREPHALPGAAPGTRRGRAAARAQARRTPLRRHE